MMLIKIEEPLHCSFCLLCPIVIVKTHKEQTTNTICLNPILGISFRQKEVFNSTVLQVQSQHIGFIHVAWYQGTYYQQGWLSGPWAQAQLTFDILTRADNSPTNEYEMLKKITNIF